MKTIKIIAVAILSVVVCCEAAFFTSEIYFWNQKKQAQNERRESLIREQHRLISLQTDRVINHQP